MAGRWYRVDAALAAAALCAAWFFGLAWPTSLFGAASWSLAVLGVLFGLGAGLRRALKIDLGLGEQLVLGAVAWITLTGPLIAIGICSRTPMLAVAALATCGAIYEIATRPHRPARPIDKVAVVLCVILAAILVIELLGMVQTRGNPFDDQVAYEAFVKRLLDRGDLIEPFSYRRVSAYGGQTSLLALAALRGDVQSTDLLDRGIFQWIGILVVIDIARRRKLHVGAIAVIVTFLLCVWDISINSAATWTGFALFTAGYGFASREDIPGRTTLVVSVAVFAAACTLRQNYLVTAVVASALLLAIHLRAEATRSSWRSAWHAEKRTVALCVALGAVVLVPYLVAAWVSNRTFLYPLVLGTMDPAAPLRPTAVTWSDELTFFLSTTLAAEPIRIWWVLAPLMMLAKDRRPLKPWVAFAIACALGFLFTVHSFMLSDSGNLWRYAWGYMTPLVVVFLVELSAKLPFADPDPIEPPLKIPGVAAFLVWVAIVAQLVITRSGPSDRFELAIHNIKAARTLETDRSADARPYRELQAAVPAGAGVAILVDDPWLFDYARNEIFNLDLPGFASPPPGLPAYLGAERWRSYFHSLDIRYIAFIDPAYSKYLYRRTAWLTRSFSDGELWRFLGSRLIDTVDTFGELARSSTVLYQKDGLILVDLGTTAQPMPSYPDEPEAIRHDRFARRLSETELGNDAWQLASRSTVVFEPDGPGLGILQIDPVNGTRRAADGTWAALLGRSPAMPPYRWIGDRTHVRVHGEGHQHYRIRAWADLDKLDTVPSIRLVIDGNGHGRARAGADGEIVLEGDATCSGWCDLYLVVSSVSEFWAPPDAGRSVKLLGFTWDEAPR